jgi:hypothetical protein
MSRNAFALVQLYNYDLTIFKHTTSLITVKEISLSCFDNT